MSIKSLWAILLLVVNLAPLSGDTYHVYQILARTDNLDALTPGLKDPKRLGTVIDGQTFILKEYTAMEIGADGIGVVDQTYPVKYVESYDEAGQPKTFATRKVGIFCRIQQHADGTVDLHYVSTAFDQWLFHGETKQFMQPLFISREMNTRVSLQPGEFVLSGIHSKAVRTKKSGTTKPDTSIETSLLVIKRL